VFSFKLFLTEAKEKGGGLTIFDIDDTLFHTTARVIVMSGKKVVKRLEPHSYNTYQLKSGESFDFHEFRDAEKFYNESKPIKAMMAKAKAILRNSSNNPLSKVIIVTARDDFDDRDKFLETFRKFGFDIDRVRVERAGKIKDVGGTANQKMIIIRNYLNTKQFARVRLFDDSLDNLRVFLSLQNEFKDIKFEAFFAKPDGTVRTIK
jgi:hypothetical protein